MNNTTKAFACTSTNPVARESTVKRVLVITETVGPSGLPRLTFEVTSNQKVQIPLYYLKILTFERMLRNL